MVIHPLHLDITWDVLHISCKICVSLWVAVHERWKSILWAAWFCSANITTILMTVIIISKIHWNLFITKCWMKKCVIMVALEEKPRYPHPPVVFTKFHDNRCGDISLLFGQTHYNESESAVWPCCLFIRSCLLRSPRWPVSRQDWVPSWVRGSKKWLLCKLACRPVTRTM